MSTETPTWRLLAGLALLCASLIGGCGAAVGDAAHGSGDAGPADPDFEKASVQLANHDVEAARSTYSRILEERPDSGKASAGKAVTELLLIPGSEPMNELLQNHLGATGGFDAQAIIYSEDGYLYWLEQGASWEGRDSPGIKDVLADRLPWEGDRLDSLSTFMAGLDRSVGAARKDFLDVIDDIGSMKDRTTNLHRIESHIQVALDSDEFERFVLPGQTFRDYRLTLKLGKSELAVIGATLAATRGLAHYLAAQQYRWSLDQAFAKQCDVYDGTIGEGWTSWDCTVKFIDARWFRGLADDVARRELRNSRDAFDEALRFARRVIEFGLERRDERTDLTLDWRSVDPEFARNLKSFIVAVRSSLETQRELPFTEHPDPDVGTVEADFSQLFTDGGGTLGRRLESSTEWLARSEQDDASGGPSWNVSEAAVQQYFVEDVFEPGFDLTDDQHLELGRELIGEDGNRFSEQMEALFEELSSAVEDSYL